MIMEYCSFLSLINDTHILQALELRLFGGDRKEKSSTEKRGKRGIIEDMQPDYIEEENSANALTGL